MDLPSVQDSSVSIIFSDDESVDVMVAPPMLKRSTSASIGDENIDLNKPNLIKKRSNIATNSLVGKILFELDL